MPLPRRAPLFLAIGLALGYLGMLQARAWDRDPPLAVLWTAGEVEHTVRHPATGLAAWATRSDAEALVERVTEARGWRTTVRLHADAPATSVRLDEIRGHPVAFVELASLADLHLPAADLVVVATRLSPKQVLAAIPGPVAVLPGAFGEGVPDSGEATAHDRLVAPWVDGRSRVGLLTVRFDDGVALDGAAMDIPLREAPPDTPTVLGEARADLSHDTVHFAHSGLGDALTAAMLDATHADIALLNYLALRAGLAGPVDLALLEKALPFHNEVVLLTLSSAELARIVTAGSGDDTHHLLVRPALPTPLPDRDWRVATVDYLANGGRGGWDPFLAGRDRVRTRITLDTLAIALLSPPEAR
jgi:hypothetical protein